MADSQFEASPAPIQTPPPSAPAATVPASVDAIEPGWRQTARLANRLLMTGFGGIVLTLSLLALAKSLEIFGILVGLSLIGTLLLIAASGLAAIVALARMGFANGPVGFAAPLKTLGVACMSAFGLYLAMMSTMGFARGRQLRKRGKVLLPPVGPDGAWAKLPLKGEIPGESRAAVAARWRENGRTEHASVAAFARLTTDLLALGAPPELIHSANLDARDEIRHAELCFSIAKALDGKDGGPGPFPEARSGEALPANRTLALAALAVDSLIDGALHEGLSARIIARLAQRCEEPGIRALLQELAVDESRHSAHGWDVVEWCLAEGGAPVAHALRGALAGLPAHPATDVPNAAKDGGWERFGIHGEALEREQHGRILGALTERVRTMTSAVA